METRPSRTTPAVQPEDPPMTEPTAPTPHPAAHPSAPALGSARPRGASAKDPAAGVRERVRPFAPRAGTGWAPAVKRRAS
jgi:hypothetical protein